MDTSEKWECYVFGQCEVGFKAHTAGLGMKHGFMVSVCIFLPVEGADNAIFTSHNIGKAFWRDSVYE